MLIPTCTQICIYLTPPTPVFSRTDFESIIVGRGGLEPSLRAWQLCFHCAGNGPDHVTLAQALKYCRLHSKRKTVNGRCERFVRGLGRGRLRERHGSKSRHRLFQLCPLRRVCRRPLLAVRQLDHQIRRAPEVPSRR